MVGGCRLMKKGESSKDRHREVNLCQKKKKCCREDMPILGREMGAVEVGGWQNRKEKSLIH